MKLREKSGEGSNHIENREKQQRKRFEKYHVPDNHIGRSMSRSMILLHELCAMAGRAYRLANLLEISWRDLQWVEIQGRASPSQHEELPVREEVVEDEAGVISSVIVPTLEPVSEDAMEEEESTEASDQ